MKIKLLKDIPGYKAGETYATAGEFLSYNTQWTPYYWSDLIRDGWAEEIKDDIDIEEIRNKVFKSRDVLSSYWNEIGITAQESDFFTAYRIVKAVIEKLNGDWKPEMEKISHNDFICWSKVSESFKMNDCSKDHVSVIPYIKDHVVGNQVISLCEPELKVLFGVK